MFYGVLEPVLPFPESSTGGSPPLTRKPPRSVGMAATIFHWGLHPWAIYGIMGLALAVFCYNRGLPLTVRSAFYPVLGERVWGWSGHVIDVLAVFATLFGLATSLGLGANQGDGRIQLPVSALPATDMFKVLLIVLITAVATVSVMTGLDGGIKRLSQVNIVLAALLSALCHRRRAEGRYHRRLFRRPRGLLGQPGAAQQLGRAGKTRGFMHGWTTFLLGLVDFLGPVCRHVHRPHFKGPHGPRVPDFRACHPGRCFPCCG